MENPNNKNLFSGNGGIADPLVYAFEYAWQVTPHIRKFIESICGYLAESGEYISYGDGILVSKTASVASSALLLSPCVICDGAEIRHNAYIRGGVIVGRECVVGNSTELKNCILRDGAKLPHFNYAGDSIIGRGAHLGAAAVISNQKSDKTLIVVNAYGVKIPTGLTKFGAAVGDGAEIGAGCVLNPGSVVGRESTIYPLTSFRGALPSGHIRKGDGTTVPKI